MAKKPRKQREEQTEFYAVQAEFLFCDTVNFEHAKGEPATSVTIARQSGVEPLVFSLDDTRRLLKALLIALANSDDEFAYKVLINNFPADNEGRFYWPM